MSARPQRPWRVLGSDIGAPCRIVDQFGEAWDYGHVAVVDRLGYWVSVKSSRTGCTVTVARELVEKLDGGK